MSYQRPTDPVDDGTQVVEREVRVTHGDPVAPAPEPAPAPAPAYTSANVNYGTTTDPGPMSLVKRIVSLLFGILVVLIALRILLLLIAANEANAIVDFIYNVTEPLVAPFRGILSLDTVSRGDQAFDVAALVALIGWTLIYLLIMAILRLGDRNTEVA